MQRTCRLLAWSAAVVGGLVSAGCVTVHLDSAAPDAAAPFARAVRQDQAGRDPTQQASHSEPASKTTSDPNAKYTVELRAAGREPKRLQEPVTEGVFVQNALVKSGAVKRFDRMKIDLYRQRQDKPGWHKMEIRFDHRANSVHSSQDYAILPGDILVVVEDTSTPIDDLLERFSPLK